MAEKIGVKHIHTPKNAFFWNISKKLFFLKVQKILSEMWELYAQIDQRNLQEQSLIYFRFWLKFLWGPPSEK